MKHTDTRIKVTKSMFHHALLDILKEKPIDQVSVKELVEAAELNRSTFYLHYSSPLDVLKEIENQFVEEKLAKLDSYWAGAMDQGRMAAIISIGGQGALPYPHERARRSSVFDQLEAFGEGWRRRRLEERSSQNFERKAVFSI